MPIRTDPQGAPEEPAEGDADFSAMYPPGGVPVSATQAALESKGPDGERVMCDRLSYRCFKLYLDLATEARTRRLDAEIANCAIGSDLTLGADSGGARGSPSAGLLLARQEPYATLALRTWLLGLRGVV